MCDICVTSDPVRVIDLTQYANKALPKRELVVFPDEEIENGADDEEGWDEDECSDDDNNKVSDDSWRAQFEEFCFQDQKRMDDKRRQNLPDVRVHEAAQRNWSDAASSASTMVSPMSSEDWSESPILEDLGTMTYTFKGQIFVAMLTKAGGVYCDGKRYKSIQNW
eukprot:CAMPEP_0113669148 /NCGR_PEP_ID=MMETSP0038_2-20120614/4408_1 /TAXON_ID=2898 /ORGANISM="Cryptomonas paramecium" /LENGTH=164 /DNA_ID=CAMNT_0000584997 /DNA_START=302 /DNA_END=793 /DNA_ORIENTATION=- /assembly_acc=CAM_ASM_000170